MGLIAIGDVHGCLETLAALLGRLAPTPDDHLVFVGDYVDRGPDSFGVIEYLLRLGQEVPCTFLRGNHEAMMLDYLDHGHMELWSSNGGLATLESYERAGVARVPPAHLDFLRATELVHRRGGFVFVHAGLRPQLTVAENLARFGEDVFLWERSHLKAATRAWEAPVVCGHTPLPEPLDEPDLIAIDTGCVYHRHPRLGRLTAVMLPERAFVSVPYQG